MNEDQFQYTYGLYKENPFLFNEDQVDGLSKTATLYGKPFERNMEKSEFSLRRTLAQIGSGFISGFTTINVGEDPQNTAEGIARGIGSLMGFIGFIPNPVGVAGKLSTTAVARAMGIRGMRTQAAVRAFPGIQSLPMYVADKVVTGLGKTTPAGAAMKFLGEKGYDLAEEGLRLGTATGFSSWQQGVDSMAKGFVLGGLEGATFRGMANTINLGNAAMDKTARAAANALYAGLPSTLAGDPTELQVYQYLLGTYFGVTDLPWHQRKAMSVMDSAMRENMHDPYQQHRIKLAPQMIAGYKDLDLQVQDELRQGSLAKYGKWMELVEGAVSTDFTSGTAVFARALKDAGMLERFVEDGIVYHNEYNKAIQEGGTEDVALDAAGEAVQEASRLVFTAEEIRHQVGKSTIKPILATETSTVDDHELPGYAFRPIQEISRHAQNSGTMEVMLREHFSQARPEDDPVEALETVVRAVVEADPSMIGYMQGEGKRLVRQTQRSYEGSQPKPSAFIQDGTIKSTNPNQPLIYTGSGQINIERVFPSLVDIMGNETGTPFVYLKQESLQKNANFRADEDIFEGSKGFFDILKMSEGRYVPTEVVKDSGSIVLSDGFLFEKKAPFEELGPLTKNQVGAHLYRRMEIIDKIDGGTHRKHYDQLKQEFVERATKEDMTRIAGMNPAAYYDAMAVHKMMFLEQLNGGVRFEEMLQHPGKFILDPFNANKRMQLFADKNPPANPAFYNDIPLVKDESIPYVIVNDVRDSGLSVVQGGKALDDVATDGSILVHEKLFDAIAADGGIDPETGAIKASAMFALQGAGIVPMGATLEKAALFKLDAESSAQIEKQGFMMVKHKSAVKQTGFRASYDYRVNRDGSMSFFHAGDASVAKMAFAKDLFDAATPIEKGTKVNPEIYDMPISAMRINHSSSENTAHALAPTKIVTQLPGVIDDPMAIAHFMKTYVEPAFTSNSEALANYEKGDFTNFDSNNLSITRVVEELLPSNDSFSKNPELYLRLWKDILTNEHPDVDTDADTKSAERTDDGAARVFAAMLETGNVTPATMHMNPFVERWALGALRNYVMDRAMKPKVENSGTAILNPTDGFLRRQVMNQYRDVKRVPYGNKISVRESLKRGEVPEGYVLLGSALKKRKVKWIGDKQVTFERALSEMQVETDPLVLKQMEDLLTLTVVRVPAATRRDVRRLKVLGFSERQGAHLITNDTDTREMGGADHDIDKAWWYQDIDGNGNGSGAITDFFNATPKGKWVDPKDGFRERFIESPEPYKSGSAALLDPSQAFDIGRNAYQGNKSIGIPATAIRRINAIQASVLGTKQKGSTYASDIFGELNKKIYSGRLDKEYTPIRISFEADASGDKKQFMKAINATLQMAADAATDPLKISGDKILREMSRDLFENVGSKVQVSYVKVRRGDYDESRVDDNGDPILEYDLGWVDAKKLLRHKKLKELKDVSRDVVDEMIERAEKAVKLAENFNPSLNDLSSVRPLLIADSAKKARSSDGKRQDLLDLVHAGTNLKNMKDSEGNPVQLNSAWYRTLMRMGDLNPSKVGRSLDPFEHPRPVANPAIVAPFIDGGGVRSAVDRIGAIIEAGKKGAEKDAQLSVLLGAGINEPKPKSFDYREPWKVSGDINDLASFDALNAVGRLALEEIGRDGTKVIREIQAAYSVPKRLGRQQQGFLQRLKDALGQKDFTALYDSDQVSVESIDQVFNDMTQYANDLELQYGINTRRYFETLTMSSAQPSPVNVQQVKNSAGAKGFARALKNNPDLKKLVKGAAAHYRKHGYGFLPRPYDGSPEENKAYADSVFYEKRVGLKKYNAEKEGRTVEDAVRDVIKEKWIEATVRDVNRTGQSSTMLKWDGLSAYTMGEYMGYVKRITDPTPKPKAEQDEIVKAQTRSLETPSDTANRANDPKLMEQHETEMRKVNDLVFNKNSEIAKIAKKEGVFDKNTTEGRRAIALSTRLKKILSRQDVAERIYQVFGGVSEQQNIFGTGKSLRLSTLDDVENFIRFFEEAERGELMKKIMKGKNPKALPHWAYFFFPDTVGRWARDKDLHITEQVRSKMMTPDGIVDAEVRHVVSSIEQQRDYYKMSHVGIENAETRLRAFIDDIAKTLTTEGDSKRNADARELFTVSTVLRQLTDPKNLLKDKVTGDVILDSNGNLLYKQESEYWRRWKDVKETHARLLEKEYNLNLPVINSLIGVIQTNSDGSMRKKHQVVTGKDLMGTMSAPDGIINKMLTSFFVKTGKLIRDPEREAKSQFAVYEGKIDLDKPNNWVMNFEQTFKNIERYIAQSGKFPESLTVHQLHHLGYEYGLRYSTSVSIKGVVASLAQHLHDGRIDEKSYLNRVAALRKDQPFTYKEADPYEELTKFLDGEPESYLARKDRNDYGPLGLLDSSKYWPQNNHDQKILDQQYQETIELIKKESDPVKRAKYTQLLEQAVSHGKLDYNHLPPEALEGIAERREQAQKGTSRNEAIKKIQPLMARGKIPMRGWDPTEGALNTYAHALAKGRMDLFATLMANKSIADFEIRRPMDKPGSKTKHSEGWAIWQKTYLNTFLGHNTMYSDDILRASPALRQSASYFTSDRAAWEIYKKLNKWFGDDSMSDISIDDPRAQAFASKVRAISTLEGKAQLMTLLANTRAYSNNITGGNMMTMVSTGLRPWLRTFSINNFKRINPEWTSFSVVRQFAEIKGAVESMYTKEANLRGGFNTANTKAFFSDVMSRVRKNPDMPDSELIQMAKRHGLGADFVDASAWFMRSAERDLRFRSFMAHYLKARDVLGAGRNNIAFDDSWVLKMALRGVEGTQFLYHASERPQFAASSIGKIFSRFQLWSWNSVRFRRDVYKSAKAVGIRPGTVEFDRYKRTAVADLFMFGLASALPFTMFSSIVPAPMNYVADLSDYFFGEEDEKEKAFFGALPYPLNILGVAMPPSARIVTNMLALAGGDVDRFIEYNMYTFAPFGLMLRNTTKTVNNPMMGIEYMTGFPLHRLSREITKDRDASSGSSFVPDNIRASQPS